MILTWYFTCAREVIQKSKKKKNSSKFGDFVQVLGPHLSTSLYLTLIYSILNKKLEICFCFVFEKIVTYLGNIFTKEKVLVQFIFERYIFICFRNVKG